MKDLFIGIDLGGTNIAGGIVDKEGTILYKKSVLTGRNRHYIAIIKDIATLVDTLIKEYRVKKTNYFSIGIGSPGIPDKKNGILVYNNNLNFRNVPIRAEMNKFISIPVLLENDANCAALAESVAGAGKDVNDSVTITIGTGIGCGVVLNNNIFSGFNDSASELGHMVIKKDGKKCTCGRFGCFESYASATALINQTIEKVKNNPTTIINEMINGDVSKVNAKTAWDAMRAGDIIGKEIVEEYIEYLACGIINVINIFAPELVIIGGGVSKEGENLITPLKELVAEEVYATDDIKQTDIVVAKMGNDAGIVGAAMLSKV